MQHVIVFCEGIAVVEMQDIFGGSLVLVFLLSFVTDIWVLTPPEVDQ